MKTLKVPAPIPAPGFYYHHKHDLSKGVHHRAYEVLGVGSHTDEDGTFMVIYRPLDASAPVYQAGKLWDLKPIADWHRLAYPDGDAVPRFRKICDPKVIATLKGIRNRLY